MLLVCKNRAGKYADYYYMDRDFRFLPMMQGDEERASSVRLARPPHLDEMWKLAETLSQEWSMCESTCMIRMRAFASANILFDTSGFYTVATRRWASGSWVNTFSRRRLGRRTHLRRQAGRTGGTAAHRNRNTQRRTADKGFQQESQRTFVWLAERGWFRWMSDEPYIRHFYRAKMGEKLHLDPPITFNEKLQWLKLHNRAPCKVFWLIKLPCAITLRRKLANGT